MDWKDMNVHSPICYCMQVTKKEIIIAISKGARSLDDIRQMTGACTGNKCHTTNPSGRCCGEDIQAMIEYYGPLVEAFKRG